MHKCAQVRGYLLFSGYGNNEVGRVFTVPRNTFYAPLKSGVWVFSEVLVTSKSTKEARASLQGIFVTCVQGNSWGGFYRCSHLPASD